MKQFWQENKGSISILATLSIVSVLMILFLSINIGNIYAKKNLVEDTADAIGHSVLVCQIKKYIDESIPKTTSPEDIVDNMLLEFPSLDKHYNIYFGVQDSSVNFTQFTKNNYSDNDIDPTDPKLGQINLATGENFAVKFQLIHEESPLATLGEALNVSVTLQGRSTYRTALETLPDPPSDTKAECCCADAGGNLVIIACFPPKSSAPCLTRSNNQVCIDYFACQGTFFSNILNGTAFSSFLNLFKCWWDDFIDRLIGSIRKVTSVVDSWAGWEIPE
jgi:competence protein ComGC